MGLTYINKEQSIATIYNNEIHENCHTQFLYTHVIYRPFTMLTLTAALYRTEWPSWLAYKRYLETQQYSVTKNACRWKRNTNSLSRRVGIEHVTAIPKAKQNFESQTRASNSFTHDISRRPLDPLLCSRTRSPRSAGRPPPQIPSRLLESWSQIVSSHHKRKIEEIS
jgi:hypothetical protein